MVNLNIGSGPKRIDGYLSCDCFKADFIDQVFDLTNPPYPDNSVDNIYSEHSLEHTGWAEVDVALSNWYRILKPGGMLQLKMPDLKLCCLEYLRTGDLFQKWTIYGVQKAQSEEPDSAQYHKSGFSKEEMKAKLEALGFKVTKCENYDGYRTLSMNIVAHKL